MKLRAIVTLYAIEQCFLHLASKLKKVKVLELKEQPERS